VDIPRSDEEREVDLTGDDAPLLPDQTSDDTDVGWGERHTDRDDHHLRDERPPHWDDF
jgi:hypothetical protein